ncbi:MAG TPA: hypothetical protein VGH23_01215 [Rhizomicrobium sp.]|jgi:hypothetical protein
MRFALTLSMMAITLSGALMGSAVAQTSAAQQSVAAQVQPGGIAGNAYERAGVAPGTDATPERLSDGTLAESANTTALATSTYNQPTGFLPGMKP